MYKRNESCLYINIYIVNVQEMEQHHHDTLDRNGAQQPTKTALFTEVTNKAERENKLLHDVRTPHEP